jgi:hypothetical protein
MAKTGDPGFANYEALCSPLLLHSYSALFRRRAIVTYDLLDSSSPPIVPIRLQLPHSSPLLVRQSRPLA